MILFAGFLRVFFNDFAYFFHPQKTSFPHGFFQDFFYETGHLADTKTVDNISQGISCGSRVFFG